jgi:hypothetical protein
MGAEPMSELARALNPTEVVGRIKRHASEYENGGADREAEDLALCAEAGLATDVVVKLWARLRNERSERKRKSFFNPAVQPSVEPKADVKPAGAKPKLSGLAAPDDLQAILRLDAKAREDKFRELLAQQAKPKVSETFAEMRKRREAEIAARQAQQERDAEQLHEWIKDAKAKEDEARAKQAEAERGHNPTSATGVATSVAPVTGEAKVLAEMNE